MTEQEQKEHEGYANIAIPYEIRNKLKAFCALHGKSIKETAEKAIENYLKQEKENDNKNI